MAHDIQLPCDGDGACMRCKVKPPAEETLTCGTCITPWHVSCLSSPPETLASTLQWHCPDCSGDAIPATAAGEQSGNDLVAAVRAIEADESLTVDEKARKRQELMSGKAEDGEKKKKERQNDVLNLLDGSLNCSFCMQLPERPVTTPCGHNFCLKCFQRWIGQGKRTCAKCRHTIPPKMASQPRINSALVAAIRMAKMSTSNVSAGPVKVYHFVHNQDRPDKAFTTDRAQKSGKANACSGKIFVTVAPDHFGPILAENDPVRNQGVLVGECWEDRLECRQWGAHLPHVAGIAGQSTYGSQSVALSGGYEDDEDHGEWFLYTGSGGRDLSGNKRTNKEQSFDQKFEKSNEALRVSCKQGYPVRVVRSHKEKRSSYAPEKGVRYDGIYRIEKCWRKVGIQGFKVCRYLFVRCDNDPAPWTSDEQGDRPRPLPVIPELKKATDIMERKESPSWDFDDEDECWKWKKPPPISKKPVGTVNSEDMKRARKAIRQAQNTSVKEKLLKEFSCLICRQVMTLPITTPCAHNFCKLCLEGAFAGKTLVRERSRGGRVLRAQKNVLLCPSCPTDISDFLQNPQVNRELMDVIESLKHKTEENGESVEELSEETDGIGENPDLTSGNTETNAENFGKTDLKDDLQNPPTKGKPERTSKLKKVDAEGCSFNNDDKEENKISAEKPDCLDGDSKVSKLQSGTSEGGNKNMQVPAVKCSSKRKNANDGGDVGVKTRRRKVQEAADDKEENKISAEKPDCLDGDSKVSKLQSGTSEGSNKNMQVPAVKCSSKRKNANDGVVGVKTRCRKVQEAAVEGKDSPSSTLIVQSSDEDFE